jgi:hypothetical protein
MSKKTENLTPLIVAKDMLRNHNVSMNMALRLKALYLPIKEARNNKTRRQKRERLKVKLSPLVLGISPIETFLNSPTVAKTLGHIEESKGRFKISAFLISLYKTHKGSNLENKITQKRLKITNKDNRIMCPLISSEPSVVLRLQFIKSAPAKEKISYIIMIKNINHQFTQLKQNRPSKNEEKHNHRTLRLKETAVDAVR